jgi:hypothetical protein
MYCNNIKVRFTFTQVQKDILSLCHSKKVSDFRTLDLSNKKEFFDHFKVSRDQIIQHTEINKQVHAYPKSPQFDSL